MRKIFLLIGSILLIYSPSKSQDWIRVFTDGNFVQLSWVIETYDKGYLLVDNETVFSWLIKTDINGNKLWEKRVGDGQHHIYFENVEQTSDNGIILGGGFSKYDPANNDPAIVKLDACGELEWCSVINTIGVYDYGTRVKPTPQGDYILVAQGSTFIPGENVQLFKFDNSGNLRWKHIYSPDSLIWTPGPHDVRVDSDGYLISAMCYYPDPGNPTVGWERPYYIKTDTAGNILWWLVYGSGNGFRGFSSDATIKSSTGNFYSIGWHSNYCDTPVLIKCMGNGQESYFQDLIPGTCPGGVSGVNWVNDSTLIICAGGTLNGNATFRWMKTDTLGNSRNFKEFPVYLQSTYHTTKTFDNKFVSVARVNDKWIYLYKINSNLDYDSIYTHQFTYDSLCPGGVASDTIYPNCDLIVGMDEPQIESQSSLMKVFPNPSSGRITVEFSRYLKLSDKKSGMSTSCIIYMWGFTTLEVYDDRGIKVLSEEIPKEIQQLEIDVSSWNRGIYYFRQVYNKKTVASEKVLLF